jgi:transposase InsO family protein
MQDLIKECLENNNITISGKYMVRDDLLYFQRNDGSSLLVVPWNLIEQLLNLYHNNALSVHMSRDRMYSMLRNRYYWKNMHKDINEWVNACEICSKVKANQPKSNGLLIPIVTSAPFEMIGIDILGPFKVSDEGYEYVLTCIDIYTSWVEAAPLRTITADEVCQEFFKLIISRHGCPTKVLTDQGKQFTSKIFNRICKQFNIKHLESSAYHHQTNGKVERFHKFIENSLTTIIKPDQSNWSRLIDNCLFVYRTTLNRMLNESPYFLIYGRDPIMPQDLLINQDNRNRRKITSQDIDEFKVGMLKTIRQTYDKLNGHKSMVQDKYKSRYDRTHKEVKFKEGELVMVYFPVSKEGLSYKLLAKWDGPFTVTNKVDAVTYRVRRDLGRKILTMLVHVQRLKIYKPWNPKV